MSYEPTKWNTGDKITADKLNKLEAGVANAGQLFMLDMEVVDVDGNTDYVYQYDNALIDGTIAFVVDYAAPVSDDNVKLRHLPDQDTIRLIDEAYFVDDLPGTPCPAMNRISENGEVYFGDAQAGWSMLYPVDPDTRSDGETCLGEPVMCMTTDGAVFLPAGTQVVRGTKEEQQESQ